MILATHGIIQSYHSGVIVSYQQLNLNSVTTADEDNISFPVLSFDNTRTLNFKFTPTNNITSGSSPTTIMAYYDADNSSLQTNRIDVSFFSGKLQFARRISGVDYNIRSDSNSWVSGTTYDISFIIDPVTGMQMLVDGVLQADTDATTGAISPTTGNLYVGGNVPAGIRYTPFTISNLQFWSTARTLIQNSTDKDTYYNAGTTDLIESYHFKNETGFTVTGVNGNNGTISTNNAGGVTYVDSTVREII